MTEAVKNSFPPGPQGSTFAFIFGERRRDPLGFFTKIAQEYGDVSTLKLFNFRTLFLNHPADIEDMLVNKARSLEKGRVMKANMRLFGEGLLTSEGDFWLRQRRLAQPAFHRARVAAYGSTMVEYAERAMRTWRSGETRDIHEDMMQITLQVVGKTLFNADLARDAREVGETLEILLQLAADFSKSILIPLWVPTPRNLRARIGIRRLERIIYRIITQKRAEARDTGDLLSMLLAVQDEDGSRMTDKQLRDETITLFLAGHETTANALSWTLWLLAKNPRAERKFYEELDGVLGGRAPSVEDIPRLTYTSQILSESMRLYPPAWGMARLVKEPVEVAGYKLIPGNGIACTQWVVHRDPRWFDDPLKFIPERWENDFAKKIPRFAYFPFGGGPRQCIGNSFALMEATLILATVAQKFRFRLDENHPVKPLASITLRPAHGIRATLEAR
ncbi:MAG: cytochrome P450 [Acidobacteria bacterium]|nr:cytochrome P450 [Acidobacteriota bacterium]MBS1865101.1 cytochrome P450 [Acidobacteriota bacterium]